MQPHKQGYRRLICLLLCVAMMLSLGVTAFADDADPSSPPQQRRGNQNYYSNQGELQADAFTMLPLGAVQPKEWLKEQLLLQKEGLLGNMQDNYPIYSASNGWRGGSGDTWEKGPYYFRGLTQTAFVLNDEDLKAKAMKWIDWTLDNQRKNGFIGPLSNGDGTSKNWDWWPRMVVLLTLQDYYEATEQLGTPDERVLTFLEKYFKYQLEHIDQWPLSTYNWDGARGGDNIEVVLWLYNRIYDASSPSDSAWLITLANKLNEKTYPWIWALQDTTVRSHVVNTTQGLKTPAVMYQITGEARARTALRYGKDNYSIDHGRIDGLPNADEAARENYPYRGTELCAVSENILSESISMRILGEGWIGDDMESLAYNSLPAAYSPDLTNMTYYQAQNQVMLTHGNHDFQQDHKDDVAFGAYSGFECCFPNGHMGWPKFVQSMWMGTNDNGLAVVAYGPNSVTAKVADGKTAIFDQTTSYPFDETVTLTYSGETAKFPLKLRIPGWCSNASIKLNGTVVTSDVVNGYLTIDRTFTKGDTVELVFPMEVRLSNWFNNAVAVEYGPLIYSLKVKEDWHVTTDYSIIGDRPHVEPFTYKETYPASGWNYALVFDENDIQSSFEVVKSDHIDAQPFNVANAPVTLKVKGQLVPDWKLMGNNVPEAPYSPLEADTSLQTEVELIPTGCSRMHMTQLPFVGEAKDTVVRDASTAKTFTDAGVKTVQFDNIIVPDADNYSMTITYSGSGSLKLNVNTTYSTDLNFAAGQKTVTVENLKAGRTNNWFRFHYDHYNRVRFIGNDNVTIEKIEVKPQGTFQGPEVISMTATANSAKLETNIDRADGFYTVRYGTTSGTYTMTSSGYHERTAYVTGLTPDTTYYMQIEMRVRGKLTTTKEFTVTTLAEDATVTEEWKVPNAFSDDFNDADASKARWNVIGDSSKINYSDSNMNIGSSSNIKAVAGQTNWKNYTVEASLRPDSFDNDRDCGVMFRVTDAADGSDNYKGYYVGIKKDKVVVGYADGSWHTIKEIAANVATDRYCNLKIVVVNNQFAIYVDNTLIDTVTPSVEYANGQVGLRSWCNSFKCDKFEVRPVNDQEKALFGVSSAFEGFTDDFSDESASKTRWNALGDATKVSYADGKMNVDSSSNIKVVAGETNWTDYTVETTLVTGEPGTNSNAGLMFRVTNATGNNADSYSGYYVGLGKDGTSGVVVGYADNSWNRMKVIPFDYKAGTAYKLKVAVLGNSFAIYVDDVLMGVIEDSQFSAGQVGVRSYSFPFTCDDFVVRAVSASEKQDIEETSTKIRAYQTYSAYESAQVKFAPLNDSYTYKIQYGTESGVYTGEYVGLTTIHAMEKLALSGLENGTRYYVRVVAVADGAEVAYSDELTVTPGTGIDVPSDEVTNLETLLTQAKAIEQKSDVLIDRIALAEKTLKLSGVNRMDLSTARACLKIAMDRNSIDYPSQTVDKTALDAAIEDANKLTEADYTAESWKSFKEALDNAETVSGKSDATQAEVDVAAKELTDAMAALVNAEKPTPVIPVTPSEPAQNPFNPNAGSSVSNFPFVDVPSDSWYYSSVKAAWEKDLIDGVTANEFKPNATLTVAQTIKLAAALHQLDRTGTVSLTNGGNNWYDSYVNYAVTNGIIEKDYANYTKAQMNAPVTRGEFVHIFHGAEEAYKAINTVADNAIPDVKTTDKFAAEIYEFYRAGILTGSDAKGTFHSASTIKRSEAAAILLRMFEASARKSITLN